MLDNVGQYWAMLDSVGQCWTMLDSAGQCWTMLDSVGQCCTVLDNFGQCWTMLGSVGQCWTMLDSVGQCWTTSVLQQLLQVLLPALNFAGAGLTLSHPAVMLRWNLFLKTRLVYNVVELIHLSSKILLPQRAQSVCNCYDVYKFCGQL
jgi:hypothetical protein